MSKTFAELGIPFPLFEANSDQASEYCGELICSFCNAERQHCFRLKISCAIISKCSNCATANGLDVVDREDRPCRQCRTLVRFPEFDDEIVACYSCLRAGKAAMTKDTEIGMVSCDQAFEGVTHGIPDLARSDFEMVPKAEGWVGARLSSAIMFELLRTPSYRSIQGEKWQFCCAEPMVYVGEWSREEFNRRSPNGDGKRHFEKIVQDCILGLWENKLHDSTGVYVFRCPRCIRMTAHWDIA